MAKWTLPEGRKPLTDADMAALTRRLSDDLAPDPLADPRVKALVEVLRPFADRLDRLETMPAAKYAVATDIDIIHLRNARAALAAFEGGKADG